MRHSNEPFRVIVIGGGVTGLAAAHRLTELAQRTKHDIDLTLLESTDRLGGVICTTRRDGFLIEDGPDNFITNKPWGVDLVQRLGLDGQLLATNSEHRRAMVVRGGRLVPIPTGFQLLAPTRLWALLASPLFSWRGKLRMAIEPFIPRRRGAAVDDDESLASFVIRRFGREALDRLVQPLVGGIYTADAEQLSMRATLGRFLDMEAQHGSVVRAMRRSEGAAAMSRQGTGARYSLFVTLRDGMSTLIDALASRIGPDRIRLGTPAVAVNAIDTGSASGRTWRVEPAAGEALDADAVIVAAPAAQAARLLDGMDGDLAAQLAAIRYASAAVVHLGYDRAQIGHPLDAFGFVVPRVEGRRIMAGSFSSVKYAGRAPQGCVLLRAFLGGAMQPELLEGDDDTLQSAARDDVAELLHVTGSPKLAMVDRWPHSMPQYAVGHVKRVAAIRDAAARHRGLMLAGNAFDGVGMPDCIHAGEQAAEDLCVALGV